MPCWPPSLSPSRSRRRWRWPGRNWRAHVHDAFGDGGGIDYSPPNKCEDKNEDNKEEEVEERGEVEVDVPVTKNCSHSSSSGGMIAAGNEGKSEATHGGTDDNKPATDTYAISAMILIEEL